MFIKVFGSGKEEEMQKALKETLTVHWPNFYKKIEPYLKTNTKFLLGNKLNVCDFMLG